MAGRCRYSGIISSTRKLRCLKKSSKYHLSDSLGAEEILRANKATLNYRGYKPTYRHLESYDHLFDKSDAYATPGSTVSYGPGGLKESLQVIRKYSNKYSYQVRKLAQHLAAGLDLSTDKGIHQLSFNIWHFCKAHIRYEYDAPGKEQLRTPARSWNDRFTGIDCDDYSIFITCILKELRIVSKFKIVAFKNRDNFSHIYVVIQKPYIVLDGVMNVFNMDPPGITKSIFEGLDGFRIRPYISFALGAVNAQPVVQQLRTTMQQLEQKKKSGTLNTQDAKELRKHQVLLALINTGEDESAGALLKMMPFISDFSADGRIIWKNNSIRELANLRALPEDLSNAEYSEAKSFLTTLNGCACELGELSDAQVNAIMSMIPDEDETLCETLSGVIEGLSGIDGYEEEYLQGLLGELTVDEVAYLLATQGTGLTGKFREKRKAKKAAKKQAKKDGKKGRAARQAGRAAAKQVKAKYAKAGSNKQKRLLTKAKILKAKSDGDKAALKAAKKERRTRIKENVKKVGRFLQKLNPVLGLARGAYLGLVRVNFLGHATKLKYLQTKKPDAWKTFIKKWSNLGGAEKRIRKAIEAGHNKKALFKKNDKSIAAMKAANDNVAGLGEVTTATAIAAASAVIPVISGLLAKLLKKGEVQVPGENTPEAQQTIQEFTQPQPVDTDGDGATDSVAVDTDGDGAADTGVPDTDGDGDIDQSDVDTVQESENAPAPAEDTSEGDAEEAKETSAKFPWGITIGVGVPALFLLGAILFSKKSKPKNT